MVRLFPAQVGPPQVLFPGKCTNPTKPIRNRSCATSVPQSPWNAELRASLPFSARRICRVQSRSAPSAAQRRDRFYGKRSKGSPKGGPGRLGVFHFLLCALKILKAESMMMLFLLFGNNDWERGDFCYDLLPFCDSCAGRRRRQHGDRPSGESLGSGR